MLNWIESVLADIAMSGRLLQRNKQFASLAIATIAVGVGMYTAVFSIVDAVLIRELPYPESRRIVSLSERELSARGAAEISFATAEEVTNRSELLYGLSLYRDGAGGRLMVNDKPEILRGQLVSPGFFQTLRIKPMLGRVFVPEDSLAGRTNVIVLSHATWQSRFAGSPDILGRTLQINDRAVRVIGVLPASFHPLSMSNPGETPQIFQPIDAETLRSHDRRSGGQAIARLKTGVTVKQLNLEMHSIMGALRHEDPMEYQSNPELSAQLLKDRIITGFRAPIKILIWSGTFVLAIACANVACLLLVRATARMKEVAIRLSLGCGASRLARIFIIDSLVLSTAGGTVGLLLAWALIACLHRLAPPELPRLAESRVDGYSALFALVICLLIGFVLGLAPLALTLRVDLSRSLRISNPIAGFSGRNSRKLFAIMQIASAYILAVLATLLIRNFIDLAYKDGGYNPRNVITMSLPSTTLSTDEQLLKHHRELIEKLRGIPGVEDVAMASTVPLSVPVQDRLLAEGRTAARLADAPVVDRYFVSPSYFSVMRIPLAKGRLFGVTDGLSSPPVGLLSQSSARILFPNVNPVSMRVRCQSCGRTSNAESLTIVGVVGDVLQHGMD